MAIRGVPPLIFINHGFNLSRVDIIDVGNNGIKSNGIDYMDGIPLLIYIYIYICI